MVRVYTHEIERRKNSKNDGLDGTGIFFRCLFWLYILGIFMLHFRVVYINYLKLKTILVARIGRLMLLPPPMHWNLHFLPQLLLLMATRNPVNSPADMVNTPTKLTLVGGWTTQLKNMSQNGFIFPKVRGENKKSLKPPPSTGFFQHPWWLGMGFLNHQQYVSCREWNVGLICRDLGGFQGRFSRLATPKNALLEGKSIKK